MALKAVLSKEAHEKIDAALRPLYAEREGKFVLDVEASDGLALENAEALHRTLERERKEHRTVKAKLESLDFDPDDGRKAIAKVKEMESWQPEEKVRKQIESHAKQLSEGYEKQIKERDDKIAAGEKDLSTVLITSAAKEAILAAKGKVKGLLPIVEPALKIVRDESGRPVARVYEDGVEKLSRKGGEHAGKPMSIQEFVETFKADSDLGGLFEGSGQSGSGASSANGRGFGAPAHVVSEAASINNPALYRAAREAADKSGAQVQLAP